MGSYELNSAKDAKGDEHLFVQRFEQNQAAIEAYKRSHGVAYEDAYQAVVGEPWPAGRSVKVSNGRAEMTKDRTTKSVLGKYVAPIAAGALTGGAALGAFGGAAAAGAGAGGLGSIAAPLTGSAAVGSLTGVGIPTGLGAITGGAAATTAATAAAKAAAKAGVLTTVPKILPWLVGAGTTAAQLYGANKASDTSREAAAIQAAAAERAAQLQYDLGQQALGFQREQWNTAQANAQPWMQAGQSALGRLTGLTGLSGGPQGTQRPSGGGGYRGPELVTMRAPDGSIRPVPRTMQPHYEAQGATVVAAAGGQ